MTRGPARKVTVEQVRVLFDQNKTHDEMIDILDVSRATLLKRLAEGNMRRVRERGGQRRTRIRSSSALSKSASLPPADHPHLIEGRTLYPLSVTEVRGAATVLASGVNHAKLGAEITKGAWKGMPIYALLLEERATCPTSCRHWRSCFGNNMHLAKRFSHGPDLERRVELEIGLLASRHPRGFAVRLHVLGDFYSVSYVDLWRALLARHPELHVFGFSARHDRDDPVAQRLIPLVVEQWDRFAIRFSNAPIDECSTVSIEHPGACPPSAVVCPQQSGRTENCGSCAFCWQSKRPVAFVQH